MNKAFVREPDAGDPACPRCGSGGLVVGPDTLRTFLAEEFRRQLSQPAFFCPHDRCDVAYFDQFERAVEARHLLQRAYPKDPQAPICACFGLTEDDIDADVQEGSPTRVRALFAQAQGPDADCARRSPSGQSCLPAVQRCYMKRTGQTGG